MAEDEMFRNLSPQDFWGNRRVFNRIYAKRKGLLLPYTILDFYDDVRKAAKEGGKEGVVDFVNSTRGLGEKSLPIVQAAFDRIKKEVEARMEEPSSKTEPIVPEAELKRQAQQFEERLEQLEKRLKLLETHLLERLQALGSQMPQVSETKAQLENFQRFVERIHEAAEAMVD